MPGEIAFDHRQNVGESVSGAGHVRLVVCSACPESMATSWRRVYLSMAKKRSSCEIVEKAIATREPVSRAGGEVSAIAAAVRRLANGKAARALLRPVTSVTLRERARTRPEAGDAPLRSRKNTPNQTKGV